MQVAVKPGHDPVGDFPFLDAYMRWALLAAEEVVGAPGLNIVLRKAGLERLINNYPPENFSTSTGIVNRDYTAFSLELLTFFGRAGRGGLIRIGRKSSQLAVKKQVDMLGLSKFVAASKLLPATLKLKAGLEFNVAMLSSIYKQAGADWHAHIEDRGDRWAYVVETCGLCVDHTADTTVCHVFTGLLQESCLWLMDKDYDVQEAQCRALGAPACVWEIGKQPKA